MRLVGFHQGKVTLELDADECLALANACRAVGSSEPTAVPDTGLQDRLRRMTLYRGLGRALVVCARVGNTQGRVARSVAAPRPLSLTERRKAPVVSVD